MFGAQRKRPASPRQIQAILTQIVEAHSKGETEGQAVAAYIRNAFKQAGFTRTPDWYVQFTQGFASGERFQIAQNGIVHGNPFATPSPKLTITYQGWFNNTCPKLEDLQAAISRNPLLNQAFSISLPQTTGSQTMGRKDTTIPFTFDASKIPELNGITTDVFQGEFIQDDSDNRF